MKNNILHFLIFTFLLIGVPQVSFAQCAAIFQKGVTHMKKGQYNSAIKAFNAAKQCDENLTEKCNSKIAECRRYLSKRKPAKTTTPIGLSINKESLKITANHTNAELIKVQSSPIEWQVVSEAKWCKATKIDSLRLAVSCEANINTMVRKTNVIITNGKMSKIIAITQGGAEEKLAVDVENIEKIDHKGDIKIINVISNTKWDVAAIPDWVTVASKDNNKLILKIEQNNNKKKRIGTVTIKSVKGNVATVILSQEKKKFKLF